MCLSQKHKGTYWQDGEKQNPSYVADSDIKWGNHLGKQLGSFLKAKHKLIL